MSDMREPGPRSREIVERERRHAAAGLQGFALYAGLAMARGQGCTLIDEDGQVLLCDAQTSGGLLIAVPETRLARLVQALETEGALAAVVGEITGMVHGEITVITLECGTPDGAPSPGRDILYNAPGFRR